MAEQYRAAIVGTGGIAKAHATYYMESDRVSLVAAAEINRASLDAFVDSYGLQARYLDYEEMLADLAPDLVSICTWNATHPEITIAAAEAGARGIICEKPLGEDLGGPADALRVCEEHGCKLTVHEQRRYMTGFATARSLIAAGALGFPLRLCWRNEGGLLNIGTHFLDAANFVLGDPAWTGVVGWIQRTTNRYERGSYCQDKTYALVDFEGGHQLSLAMDVTEGDATQWCNAIGPAGLMHFDRNLVTVYNDQGCWQPEPEPVPGFLDDLLAWIEGGPEHRNAARHAFRTQEIMMAIYESARTRTRITPPYTKRPSPLAEMIRAGELPAQGEPYDTRTAEALAYAQARRSR